jgi:Tol biopolymer transport system component
VGGTWNREGVILFAHNAIGRSALMKVPAAGGVPKPVTLPDPARGEAFQLNPEFLPDGRHFLYFRLFRSNPQYTGAYIGSVDTKPEDQSSKPFFLTDRQVSYAISQIGGLGYLLFLRESTLFAQPFELDKLVLSGEPVPVADQVGSFAAANVGLYSVSNTGILAYRVGAGGNSLQLTWFDRDGKPQGTLGAKGFYRNPAISPDETRVAVSQLDSQRGSSNIWVLDINRGTSTRLTFNAGNDDSPVWSPDGKQIVFRSNRSGHFDLYQKPADGSGEERLLLKSEEDKSPTGFSRDGRLLLYQANTPKTKNDIFVLPMEGDPKPVPVLRTEFNEGQAQFSPDGRWVAHTSEESGSPEIYVRPFSLQNSGEGAKWMISKGGGTRPRWRADGKELLYTDAGGGQQMAVEITLGEKSIQAGTPHRLFSIPGFPNQPDFTPDAKRFLYPSFEGANAQTPFTIVLNWQAGLKK